MFTTKSAQSKVYEYFPLTLNYRESFEYEIRELLEQVKQKIEYNWISCYVNDPITDNLEKLALDDSGFNMIDVIQFDNGSGLSAWVAEQKRPILLSSVHRGQRFQSNPVKSFICCPVIRNEMTIGVINLGHIRNQAYNKQMLQHLLDILNPNEDWE